MKDNTIVTHHYIDDEFGDCAVTPQFLRKKAGIEETELVTENSEGDEFGDCAVTPQMQKEKAGVENPNIEDDEFGDCSVTPQMLLEKTENKSKTLTEKNTEDNTPKLFSSLPTNNEWWIDRECMFNFNEIESTDTSIHIPVVVDTEFWSNLKEIKQRKRSKLTLQVKGIHQSAPSLIFVPENLKSVINSHRIGQKTKPFYPIKNDFFLVDCVVSWQFLWFLLYILCMIKCDGCG